MTGLGLSPGFELRDFLVSTRPIGFMSPRGDGDRSGSPVMAEIFSALRWSLRLRSGSTIGGVLMEVLFSTIPTSGVSVADRDCHRCLIGLRAFQSTLRSVT